MNKCLFMLKYYITQLLSQVNKIKFINLHFPQICAHLLHETFEKRVTLVCPVPIKEPE